MTKIYFTFSIICLCFYSLNLNAQTIPNDTIGGLDFYTWAPSFFTKSLDTTSPISGNKSLKLNITSIGEWWTIQLRLETVSCLHYPIDFKAGYTYRMTYKIRSTAPETIIHLFHKAGNPTDYQENVSLAGGNVIETKTFTTPVIIQSGGSDFAWYWALGYPVTPTTITIDDIVIEELSNSTAGTDEQVDNQKMDVYSTSGQLNVKTAIDSKVVVLDLTGRIIVQQNVKGDETATIPIANNSGFILVKATDNQRNTIIRKVIMK